MNLENATKLMETDSIVLFDEQPRYILYIDSLSQTCTISDRPASYIGTRLIKKNVKIKTLQRGNNHEQTQNRTRKSYIRGESK